MARILWSSPPGSSGYAEFGRAWACALADAGHDVIVRMLGRESLPPAWHGPKGEAMAMLALRRLPRTSAPPDVEIVCTIPPAFGPPRTAAPHWGFSMYEADAIPASWVPHCNRMAGILVPSTHSAAAFARAGVTVPIRVVGCPAAMREYPAPAAHEPGGTFRAIAIMQWSSRKDPEALLRGWARAFGPDDGAVLTIHANPVGRADVCEEFLALTRTLTPCALVNLELTPLPRPELLARIAESSVLVSTAHGEGWGMSYVDALACGVPVVAPIATGERDFLSRANTFEIATRPELAAVREPELAEHYAHAPMWAACAPAAVATALGLATVASARATRGRIGRANVAHWLEPATRVARLLDAVGCA